MATARASINIKRLQCCCGLEIQELPQCPFVLKLQVEYTSLPPGCTAPSNLANFLGWSRQLELVWACFQNVKLLLHTP